MGSSNTAEPVTSYIRPSTSILAIACNVHHTWEISVIQIPPYWHSSLHLYVLKKLQGCTTPRLGLHNHCFGMFGSISINKIVKVILYAAVILLFSAFIRRVISSVSWLASSGGLTPEQASQWQMTWHLCPGRCRHPGLYGCTTQWQEGKITCDPLGTHFQQHAPHYPLVSAGGLDVVVFSILCS